MVSRVKTDMPCCYQHKTLNITGNGTKTVLKYGEAGAELNVRLSAASGRVSERVCECQRNCRWPKHQSPPKSDERQWHG